MLKSSFPDNLIACLHCDLLLRKKSLKSNQRAVCPRCGGLIYYSKNNIYTSLALSLAGIIIYIPTIVLPFLRLQVGNTLHEVNLLGSLVELTNGTGLYLALTVLVLVILLPMIKICGIFYIVISIISHRIPSMNINFTRYILQLASWGMIEVYLIGVIVTLIKLSSIAEITFLSGFYMFLFLMLIDSAISITLPRKRIWLSKNYGK